MQTQTHLLFALAVLSRKNSPKRNRAVFIGALIPDLFIYVAWAYYTLSGNSQTQIWDVLYFQNPTQFWDALFNSVPVFLTIASLGWVLALKSAKYKLAGQCIGLFGAAALIHIATDFPVHASDAHRHFWPLSDWRFYSPLSYWEGDHHAALVSVIEAIGGVLISILLWRRFERKWTRRGFAALAAFYVLMFIVTLLIIAGVFGNHP